MRAGKVCGGCSVARAVCESRPPNIVAIQWSVLHVQRPHCLRARLVVWRRAQAPQPFSIVGLQYCAINMSLPSTYLLSFSVTAGTPAVTVNVTRTLVVQVRCCWEPPDPKSWG